MPLNIDIQILYALTKTEVSQQLANDTLERAQAYYEGGRLYDLEIEDSTLFATVEESAYAAHEASITVGNQEIHVGCTCNHGGAGLCAHAGALMIAWTEDRTSFSGYDSRYEPKPDTPLSPMSHLVQEYGEILSNQTINELRALARTRNIKIHGTRKQPIVEELAAHLCDLDEIQAQVRQLDSVAQELLTFLHLTLSYGYGFTGENIIGGLQRRHAEITRRTIHAHLVSLSEYGLLLTFKQNSQVYYMLPQAVRVCLPSRPGFVAPYPAQELDQLAVQERNAAASIQSLYAVWNYILEKRPRRHEGLERQAVENQWHQLRGWNHLPEEILEITSNRRTPYNLYNASMTVPAAPLHLRRADLRALSEQTTHSDQEIEFYYTLLQDLGAVAAQPGETILSRQESFERVLSLPPSMQMYTVIYAWVNSQSWSEMDLLLRSAPQIHVRRNLMYAAFTPQELYQEWRSGRQTVMRFLSTLDENQWTSVNSFLLAIFEVNPNLLYEDTNTAVWWLESSKTKKQFGTTFEDWLDSVGQFVLTMLQGPLYWLGAVSLGYRDKKLAAIKVTPVGSFALQRRQEIVEPAHPLPEEAVRLHDDLRVTLTPSRVPAQVHDLLHAIGTLEETTPDRFVYRITAEGVLLALEQGQTIDSLLKQISAWCGSEIPETWQVKISAWSENYGKLHVYDEITLIEFADDYALQELGSNTALRKHIIHQFSPRLVAIQPDVVDDLIREMEKRGYTPRIE